MWKVDGIKREIGNSSPYEEQKHGQMMLKQDKAYLILTGGG